MFMSYIESSRLLVYFHGEDFTNVLYYSRRILLCLEFLAETCISVGRGGYLISVIWLHLYCDSWCRWAFWCDVVYFNWSCTSVHPTFCHACALLEYFDIEVVELDVCLFSVSSILMLELDSNWLVYYLVIDGSWSCGCVCWVVGTSSNVTAYGRLVILSKRR